MMPWSKPSHSLTQRMPHLVILVDPKGPFDNMLRTLSRDTVIDLWLAALFVALTALVVAALPTAPFWLRPLAVILVVACGYLGAACIRAVRRDMLASREGRLPPTAPPLDLALEQRLRSTPITTLADADAARKAWGARPLSRIDARHPNVFAMHYVFALATLAIFGTFVPGIPAWILGAFGLLGSVAAVGVLGYADWFRRDIDA